MKGYHCQFQMINKILLIYIIIISFYKCYWYFYKTIKYES